MIVSKLVTTAALSDDGPDQDVVAVAGFFDVDYQNQRAVYQRWQNIETNDRDRRREREKNKR